MIGAKAKAATSSKSKAKQVVPKVAKAVKAPKIKEDV